MVSLRGLAKLLVREAAYRSFRGGQAAPFLPSARQTRSGVRVSVVSANVIGAFLYSLLSFAMAGAAYMTSEQYGPWVAFSTALTFLVGFALAMAVMQASTFTSAVIREGLIDLLRLYPLTDKEIVKVYAYALILYWGGLAVAFLFAPFLAAEAYLAATGYLSPAHLLVAVFAAVTTLGFAYSAGLALGAQSYIGRRAALMRAASAAGWVLTLLLFFLTYYSYTVALTITEGLTPFLARWGYLIPFVGPAFADTALKAGASLAITTALLAPSLRAAVSRFSAIFHGLEASAPLTAGGGSAEAVVRGKLAALVVKDLKLLSREPRLFANAVMMAALPILMMAVLSMTRSGSGLVTAYTSPAIATVLGVFSSLATDTLYFVESSGAKALYYLPITRAEIAASKALATMTITIPAVGAATAAISAYSGTPPHLTAANIGLATATAAGFTLINSAIMASWVPKEPSEWGEQLFMRDLSSRLRFVAVRLGVAAAGLAIILAAVIPANLLGVTQETLYMWLAVLAVIAVGAGLTAVSLTRNPL